MKQTRLMMGMPVIIEILDSKATDESFKIVYEYFTYIDEKFSTYKETSEISRINKGLIAKDNYSTDMKTVFQLSEETKKLTHGYFDIYYKGKYDPSGLVKGWAIYNAAELLKKAGYTDYYIDVGGDIQVAGKNNDGKPWSIGIRNPFNRDEIVKVLYIVDKGVATSGTYIRGQHIYNPVFSSHSSNVEHADTDSIVSLTVIGPNVYEADRFATAAFAMGRKGIQFIEHLDGFEAYMIDMKGIATMTSYFNTYVHI